MYLYSSRVVAIDYKRLRCRRILFLISNRRTLVLRVAILRSFAANSSIIIAILSCILFYLARSASLLRSIISWYSMSGAGYRNELGIGGEEGKIVDMSSGRGKRGMDKASSLSGICVYKNIFKVQSFL